MWLSLKRDLGSQLYTIHFFTRWYNCSDDNINSTNLTAEKTYLTIPRGSVVAIHNPPFHAVRDKITFHYVSSLGLFYSLAANNKLDVDVGFTNNDKNCKRVYILFVRCMVYFKPG
jgi:hypothetical protein